MLCYTNESSPKTVEEGSPSSKTDGDEVPPPPLCCRLIPPFAAGLGGLAAIILVIILVFYGFVGRLFMEKPWVTDTREECLNGDGMHFTCNGIDAGMYYGAVRFHFMAPPDY